MRNIQNCESYKLTKIVQWVSKSCDSNHQIIYNCYKREARGSVVVKALCYKPEGRGFVTG
jgi:hypothetical protein